MAEDPDVYYYCAIFSFIALNCVIKAFYLNAISYQMSESMYLTFPAINVLHEILISVIPRFLAASRQQL